MMETEEAPVIEDAETKDEADAEQDEPKEAVPEEVAANEIVTVRDSFMDKQQLDNHLLEMLKDETTESEKGEVVNEIEANADQGNLTGVVDHEESGEENANGDNINDQLIDEEDESDKEEDD